MSFDTHDHKHKHANTPRRKMQSESSMSWYQVVNQLWENKEFTSLNPVVSAEHTQSLKSAGQVWEVTSSLWVASAEAGQSAESQQVIGSWRPVSHLSELVLCRSPQLIKSVNNSGEVIKRRLFPFSIKITRRTWVTAWNRRVWLHVKRSTTLNDDPSCD